MIIKDKELMARVKKIEDSIDFVQRLGDTHDRMSGQYIEILSDLQELKLEVARLKRFLPSYTVDHTAIPSFAKERMAEIEEDGA